MTVSDTARSHEKCSRDALAGRRAEARAQLGVAEQPLQRGAQRRRRRRAGRAGRSRRRRRGRAGRRPPRRRPAGRAPSPRRRRRRSPRGATGRRRRRRARRGASSSSCGTQPSAPGHAVAQRAVARDDERQAARRLDELEHALLRGEPPGVEHVRRLVRLGDRRPGTSTPLGITRTSARAELARSRGELLRGADREPRARAGSRRASQRARAARARRRCPRAGRRTACRSRAATAPGGQPVRVDEVGVARRSARRAREGARASPARRSREPWPPAQVADDAVAVGDPEVAERRAARRPRRSTPRARSCSTASATKRPATSSGERGYDVVRTTTFTGG